MSTSIKKVWGLAAISIFFMSMGSPSAHAEVNVRKWAARFCARAAIKRGISPSDVKVIKSHTVPAVSKRGTPGAKIVSTGKVDKGLTRLTQKEMIRIQAKISNRK